MSLREAVDVRTYIDGRISHTHTGILIRDGNDFLLRVDGITYTVENLPVNCQLVAQAGPLLLAWAARRRECKCVKKLS